MKRAVDSAISPALIPLYRYIDRLPEPARSVFVHDLQRYCASRRDLPIDVRITRPR